jgi:hypothetical protein
MAHANYPARVQAVFLATLRRGPSTVSAAIREHGLAPPAGFDTRAHSAIIKSLRQAGIIEPMRIDRSASPTAHRGFVTMWRLVRHG